MHLFLLYGAYIEANTGLNHATFDIANISCILAGIVFIILGNYMPKTKKNNVVVARTAWSMYNNNTWRKSNRFGSIKDVKKISFNSVNLTELRQSASASLAIDSNR